MQDCFLFPTFCGSENKLTQVIIKSLFKINIPEKDVINVFCKEGKLVLVALYSGSIMV